MAQSRNCIGILIFFAVSPFLFFFPHTGYAVPAAPTIHTLTQSDGTFFKARRWGDESCHGWETAEGYTILFDENIQSWTYAMQDSKGNLASSSKVIGRDSIPDRCFPHIRLTGQARSNIVLHMTTKETRARDPRRKDLAPDEIPGKVVSPTGTAKIPVILINFADTTATYTKGNFNALLFDSGNYSMKDYYEEVSYGKFTVSAGLSGVVGWYTASNTHNYYGQNNASGNDSWAGDLVYEAVKAADADVDFSEYDTDGDGYVDVVDIVHQGTDEAASASNTDIWSHRWSLESAQYYGQSHYGEYTTNDKNSRGTFVKINDYLIVAEKSSTGTQETIGVFAHEYGHALGLPDLYDTDYSSSGIGDWSIMAAGSYNYVNKSGDRPAHMDAWCKYFLGWITPTQVSGTLTDESISQASTSADVYKLLNGSPLSGEYFLVENRQKTGFDAGLPGSGLLIWHIDGNTIANKSYSNTVNDSECYPPNVCPVNHYGVALEQADGNWNLETSHYSQGDSGDPYPGSTNNRSFTDSSVPDSKLYDTRKSTVSVTNISNADSFMTATLSVEDTAVPLPTPGTTYPPITTPTPLPTTAIKGIISGFIEDTEGNLIADAKIRLKGKNTRITLKTLSNENGLFAFADLDSGIYVLRVAKKGYKTTKRTITLEAGEGVEIGIKLKKLKR